MDIFGLLMIKRLILNDLFLTISTWSSVKNLLNIPIIFFYLIIISCTPSMNFGKSFDISNLDQLKIYYSTKSDIIRILGEPQGHGFVRSPTFGIKEVLLYEFTILINSKAKNEMLMIFIDKNKGLYHGNMWFKSSLNYKN